MFCAKRAQKPMYDINLGWLSNTDGIKNHRLRLQIFSLHLMSLTFFLLQGNLACYNVYSEDKGR